MPRPRSVSRTDDTVISNGELARIFNEIGDMLDILGEVVYKGVAYRRVADVVERYPDDVAALYIRGEPPKIPGAGPALSAKLEELARTGRLEYHERLRAQVPAGLLEMLRVPGVGPKTVRLLHVELGIDSVDALRAAAEEGRLRSVKGLSARTEQNVIEGIGRIAQRSTRLLLHDADALVAGLLAALRDVPGVRRIEPAGSLRRRRATIGDIDLLAGVDDPAAVIAALDGLSDVERILSAGTDKSSIVLREGPQVDLMVCSPAAWGSHLVHFTGNADHNIGLRGMALDRGWSLSEKGFSVLDTGELLTDAEEADVYERLDLPWIPPELREAGGEIEAARSGDLPQLVTVDDVRGDTHTHSNWTDGVDTIEVMARAARDMGHEYIVLTDHSPSLGVARGLSPERVEEQRAEIARVNAELAPFRILHGTELEIRADATLDYPDELLARFDVVIASIHTGRGQSSEQLTARALAAIEHPHVDVLAHPSGRIVNRRDPLPLDWPRLFEAAARTGTALEINGSPRLDLDDALARAAGRAGARLTLASDAHRTEELAQQRYAVDMARRAWLGPDQILATRSADELVQDGRMIGRLFADRQRLIATRRADRLAAVVIALLQAAVAAGGWFAEPVWLAVAIAAQLFLGGLAAVYVIGPVRPELGLARYAMPSAAGIAATLFGRLIPGGLSLLLIPFVAVLLWAVTYLELRLARGTGGRTIHDLLLMSIVFTGTAGLIALFGAQAWPTPMIAVAVLTLPVAIRSAETRGVLGVEAVGQALLHVLVVTQIGLAASLLNLAPTVLAGLVALAFYAWAGAVDALRGESPGRSVAVEFGALLVFGIIIGLLMFRP